MTPDTLMTAQEVADHVRVNVQTFRRWCREGKGPKATRLSEHIERYALPDVMEWLANCRERDCA